LYSVSSGFLTNIKDANILKKGRVVIGSTTLDESYIVYFKIDESFGSGNRPAIGGVAAAKLTLELINTGTLPGIVGQTIKPAVAIDVNGTFEWVELGVFYPEQNDVKLNPDGLSYTIECFDILGKLDRQDYATTISFPATLSSFLSDITTNYSLTFETQTLPSVSITTKPTGTVRQVLGEVASLISRNVTLSRSSASNIGKLKFVFTNSTSFIIDGNSYYDLTLLSENSISISKLVLEGQDLYSGTSSGYTLSFANSQVTTQAELDTVYNRFFPFEYTPFTLSSYGFPHLETGDLISVIDNDNTTRTLLICGHSFLYDGGFESALIAEIANDTEYSSSADGGSSIVNTVTNTVNRATELITGNKGGYITTVLNNDGKPEQLVISDTADYKTATRVWRWNQSGLGYSSTGYNGSYDLAMTSDGQIVADFIKTGKLSTADWDNNILPANEGKIDLYSGQFLSTTNFTNEYKEEISIGQVDALGNQSIDLSSKDDGRSISSTTNITSFSLTGCTGTSGTNTLTVSGSGLGLCRVGYTVSGTGIPAGTTITSNSIIDIELSNNFTSNLTNATLTVGVPTSNTYKVVQVNFSNINTIPYPDYSRISIENLNEVLNGENVAFLATTSSIYISVVYGSSAVPNTSGLGKIYAVKQKMELIAYQNSYSIDFFPQLSEKGGNGYLSYFTDNDPLTPSGEVYLYGDSLLDLNSSDVIKIGSINGTEITSGTLKIGNTVINTSGGISQTGTPALLNISPYGVLYLGRSTNNANFAVQIFKGDGSTTTTHFLSGQGNSYIVANSTGNLGVGLTNPSEKLDVSGNARATRFISTQATGTAPFTVASTTLVTNLNADLLDGLNAANTSGSIPINNGTLNTNLNAQFLSGYGHAGIAGSKFLTLYAGPAATTSVTSYTDVAPTIFLWENEYSFNGRTVYFEVIYSTPAIISGNFRLSTSGGTAITTLSPTATTSATRVRSTAITLTDGTTYKVQISSGTSGQTVSLHSARIIIL